MHLRSPNVLTISHTTCSSYVTHSPCTSPPPTITFPPPHLHPHAELPLLPPSPPSLLLSPPRLPDRPVTVPYFFIFCGDERKENWAWEVTDAWVSVTDSARLNPTSEETHLPRLRLLCTQQQALKILQFCKTEREFLDLSSWLC